MVPGKNKTEDTNQLTLLAFKIIAILHNTLLVTFIKLLETVSKHLFRNRSQNCCHKFLDCHHVCKTCAFHDALQAGKQKEVRPPYSHDMTPTGAISGEYGGLKEGMVRNFLPEKIRRLQPGATRDLGYQRPACYPLDH
jgi:hypothetical protein